MFDLIRNRFRARPPAALDNGKAAGGAARLTSQIQEVRVGNDDPLLAYILNNPGVIEVDSLDMPDSEALQALKQNGIKISVPLVSQGELIGMLNLGPRLSEQDYGSDDRRLLNTLSVQVSPALRVAQLARRRQQEARERERIEQELRDLGLLGDREATS
jgi:GAF domain-containing protein